MKKLDLVQMEKVNGGGRCTRYGNRHERMGNRSTTEGRRRRMGKMLLKYMANCA